MEDIEVVLQTGGEGKASKRSQESLQEVISQSAYRSQEGGRSNSAIDGPKNEANLYEKYQILHP